MKESRRDFIKASAALGVLGVTKASAQPRALDAKTVGFVVSTRYKPSHIGAFFQALDDGGWESSDKNAEVLWLSAGGKYGAAHDELKNHGKRHIDRTVDLIVAAGGVPAAVAVATALREKGSAIPFIFLIGRYPTSNSVDDADAADLFNSSNKAGGVDQNVPAQNEANYFKLLKPKGVAIEKAGLIVNGNNPITAPEVTAWTRLRDPDTGRQPDARLIFRLTGENDQSVPRLLKSIKDGTPRPDGIIASSDPYLRSVGGDFDTQLRAATGGSFAGWVCYPYKEYVLANATKSMYSTSTPSLASDDPTDPSTAYYQLGLKAVQVLNQLAQGQTSPNAKITTWDGRTSTWVTPP